MTQALAPAQDNAAVLERVIIAGDLSRLSPADRVAYYAAVCDSVGLNPLTQPLEYITLNGKLTLYAKKGATDQIRSLRSISIDSVERDTSDPEYATWLVTGHDATGRVDTEIGSVSIKGLSGEARANAIMKALTKGKRRLTLSLAGLGFLDETEVDGIPGARVGIEPTQPPPTLREQIADRKAAVTTRAVADDKAVATDTTPVPRAPDPVAEPAAEDHPTPSVAGDADIVEAVAVEVEPVQCESTSPYEGATRCAKEAGHKGNHANRDRETW